MDDGIVTIDGVTAGAWLELYKTDVQRDTDAATIAELSAVISAGNWVDGLSTIHFGRLGGRLHLIDGQNRLSAIVRAGIPVQSAVRVHDVDTRENLVNISEVLNKSKRHTILDKLLTRGAIADLGFNRHEIVYLKGAFVFIDNEFNGSNSAPLKVAQIEKMLHEYAKEASWFLDAVRSAKQPVKNAIHWGVTIALGLVTFKEAPKLHKTCEFWEGVAHGVNSGDGDPRGMAYNFLVTHKLSTSQGVANGKKLCTHQKAARYVARCFTAWAKDETIRSVVVDESKPILIYGTRFKG